MTSGSVFAKIRLNYILRRVLSSAETIKKIGYDFFALYTGLDDLELLNEYYAKQELLYAFNVCLTVGIGPEKIRNNASKILDRQLRKTVIPNEATLRELLQNL